MKKYKFLVVLLVLMELTACSPAENVEKLAKEAYIYAFPAVEHNKPLRTLLTDFKAPPNYFIANTEFFTHENTVIVSPNNDTYYSYAVLDIRNEPAVIGIPSIEGRYFSIQFSDVFTNCPDYVSTLATGEGPGNYMIALPDWSGDIPEGIDKVLRVPATVVVTLARTQVFGPEDGQAGVIARSYRAVPLSEFAGTAPPESEPLSWPYEMFDAKSGDIEDFFRMFNIMMQYQIPNDTDKAMMKKFEAIGLGAGKEFGRSQFAPEVWSAIEAGAREAKAEIEARTNSIGSSANNWDFSPLNAGRWGTDYMTRAAAAWKYIYVNVPEEAVYPTANRDGDGDILDGSNNYVVTFTREQIPHVKFFWSLTMYNNSGFLVDNPAGRYNIKNIDDLVYGDDGSLTLYIRKESPGARYENNWLPAPQGRFYMILRMYGPSEEALNGGVVIPPVEKIIQ